MNYLIIDTEGEDAGRIVQSNKVFQPAGYDARLAEMGLAYKTVDSPTYLNPEAYYIKNNEIEPRPPMNVQVSGVVIPVGEAAIFNGVPTGAHVECFVGESCLGEADIPAGRFDFPVPAPGNYSIRIIKWPYRDFVVEIKGV